MKLFAAFILGLVTSGLFASATAPTPTPSFYHKVVYTQEEAERELGKQLATLRRLNYQVQDYNLDFEFKNYAVVGSGGANPVWRVWVRFTRP